MRLERENFQDRAKSRLSKKILRNSAFAGLFIVSSVFSRGENILMHKDPELPTVSDTLVIPAQETQRHLFRKPIERNIINSNPIIKPTPKPGAAVDVNEGLSRITGYYCKRVEGYSIGDGGGYCGNTASGKPVEEGMAACGDKWPLGATLEIQAPNYDRTVVCEDRGRLEPDQIDIYFPTNRDLVQSNHPSYAHVKAVR